jgi:deazaflavin-dependent oxidoreductase (nitroreductase family)
MQVLLTTTGRRTGEPRQVKLYGWPDGDRIVVVGSWGGAARDPAWAHNLRDHPRARLRIGKRDRSATATEVEDGPERNRLWQMVCRAFPMYASYQQMTPRRIPLFVLDMDAAEPARGDPE